MNNLQGGIPNSLGKLQSLTFLGLGANNLTGTLPPSIYNFSVHMNQLHGTLPPGLGHSIFPNIDTFLIHMNQFSGPIPISVSNASKLLDFEIQQNEFIGKVPSLACTSSLYWLGLDDNNLGNDEEGDLDFLSSLVNCTNLSVLVISNNSFGGVLPESISNLTTKLRMMIFGSNQIRGSIPIGFKNLINLEILGLEYNLLTGTIPNSISKLNKLSYLFLNMNKLSGTIPSSLGNLTLLERLNFLSNSLQGSIPQSLGECRNLLLLDLSENNLSGLLPKQVANLSSLSQYLDLSNNQFTRSIPAEVGNLVNLVELDVAENKLSGEIPQSLGSCTSLRGLYLMGNLLQRPIPEALSSLRGIEEFDLSDNNLSGRIPNFLGSFRLLQYLNLSFNDFEGLVPKQGVFKNTNALFVMGNTYLCGAIPQLRLPICISKQSKQGMSARLKMIISFACGLTGLILVFPLVRLYRSRKSRVLKPASGSSLGVSLMKVSYGDLLKATDGFSAANLIGVGSFGSVYRGILNQPEERIVAVKVLNLQSSRASKSFAAECEALKGARHRNLVKLLTACSSIDFQGNNFKALVYEFMVNGSLEDWLHISAQRVDNLTNQQKHLNLIQRVNIAIDVASALDYLHNRSHMRIVHCDLKPSNVLLDSDMTACVGDFGLARLLPDASDHPLPAHESTSSAIKGSIGYAAPEYGMGTEVSTYGDVYSYGILLLEMFTGKRPTDEMFKDGVNVHNFVMMTLHECVEEVCEVMLLQGEESSTSTNATENRTRVHNDQRQRVQECLISFARIGVACSADLPQERMDISKVVAELCLIRDVLTGTRMPRYHYD